MFSIKPCSSEDEFEVFPDSLLSLDLLSAKEKLKGYEIISGTKQKIMAGKNKIQFLIFQSGKIIVKNAKEKELAEKESAKIYELLGLCLL